MKQLLLAIGTIFSLVLSGCTSYSVIDSGSSDFADGASNSMSYSSSGITVTQSNNGILAPKLQVKDYLEDQGMVVFDTSRNGTLNINVQTTAKFEPFNVSFVWYMLTLGFLPGYGDRILEHDIRYTESGQILRTNSVIQKQRRYVSVFSPFGAFIGDDFLEDNSNKKLEQFLGEIVFLGIPEPQENDDEYEEDYQYEEEGQDYY